MFHTRRRAGSLTLTGQLGEVLEESARIALSWIRAHEHELQLVPDRRRVRASGPHTSLPSSADADGPGEVPGGPGEIPKPVPELGLVVSGYTASSAPAVTAGSVEALVAAAAGVEDGLGMGQGAITVRGAAVSTPCAVASPLQWDLHIHLPAGERAEGKDRGVSGRREGVEVEGGGMEGLQWDLHIHLPAGESDDGD